VTGLLRFDQDVFRAIHQGWHQPWLDPFFLVLSYSGLGQVQALFALLFLRKKDTKYFTLPLLATILISGLVVAQGLKQILERDRPSNLAYALPQEAWLTNSFPSGHTTTSFAVATMLVLLTYGTRREWYGAVAFLWAVLVGISRIYRGVHWPTDVLAGLFAGILAAALTYLLLNRLGRQLHLETPAADLSGQHQP